MLEHYAGKLPLWLAPVQAVVATVTADGAGGFVPGWEVRGTLWAEVVARRLRRAGRLLNECSRKACTTALAVLRRDAPGLV